MKWRVALYRHSTLSRDPAWGPQYPAGSDRSLRGHYMTCSVPNYPTSSNFLPSLRLISVQLDVPTSVICRFGAQGDVSVQRILETNKNIRLLGRPERLRRYAATTRFADITRIRVYSTTSAFAVRPQVAWGRSRCLECEGLSTKGSKFLRVVCQGRSSIHPRDLMRRRSHPLKLQGLRSCSGQLW